MNLAPDTPEKGKEILSGNHTLFPAGLYVDNTPDPMAGLQILVLPRIASKIAGHQCAAAPPYIKFRAQRGIKTPPSCSKRNSG
jgi:hypothetical protein